MSVLEMPEPPRLGFDLEDKFGESADSANYSVWTNDSRLTTCVRLHSEVNSRISFTKELLDFSVMHYFSFSSLQKWSTLHCELNTEVSFPREVSLYLTRNPDMFHPLSRVSQIVDDFLGEHKIESTHSILIGTDVEAPDWESLVIRYALKNVKHSEVLRLWNEACEKASKELTSETAKKLFLLFDAD